MNNRRNFLSGMASLSFMPLLAMSDRIRVKESLPISCNTYTWVTFYKRQGKTWWQDPQACAKEFARSGIKAMEPNLPDAEEAKSVIEMLKKYDIQMPSIYVNSILHQADDARKSIATVLEIAREVIKYNTKIIVTNPSPIKWGGSELKTDQELIEEARNVDLLGRELKKLGLTLAYHTHDTELLAGAREFHHILQNTSPDNVSFCYDVHWLYRGSKNSQVAAFDILKMYGDRIVELHLRQSINGIWTETFGEGDIDYKRFALKLKEMNIRPHLVIEQCVEDQSANTINVVEAHQKDIAAVKEIFKGIIE